MKTNFKNLIYSTKYKNNNNFFRTGFTLVETLVYIAIFSFFIGSLVLFMNTLTISRLNNQITLEVNNQASQIIRNITSSIENAKAINSPILGSTSQTLSLVPYNSIYNPTIFYLNNGTLFMTEGANAPIPLSNNKVIVSNLIFSNLGMATTSGSVRIEFTLTSNIANSGHIIRTSSYHGSASIRQ